MNTDITTLTEAELWKLAFEQQQIITASISQVQQAQANIAVIQAQIQTKERERQQIAGTIVDG